MLKKATLVLFILALVALSVVPVMGQEQQPLRIAFSVPGLQFPFFVHMLRQVEDEAALLGNIEIIILDGRDDTTKQIADLESVIAASYDGLVVSPRAADALAPAVQEVINAGIPVVTIDRNVSGETAMNTLAHVGADNVKGGEAQAELIRQLFPDGARVFNLQGTPGASPAIDRNRGLHNILDEYAEYEIIFEQTANFNRADGLNVTENGLAGQETPPDVINAANDDMALGAVEALKARDLIGEVVVLGFDALPEALLSIQAGELTGTVEQFPGGQARAALNIIVAYLREGVEPAEHDNYLIPRMITLDNLMEAERIGEIMEVPEPGSMGRIVFIPKSTDVSYWLWVKAGVESRAAELGYSTDYQGVPREIDIAQQADLVRNVASTRPAGIVMAATDAEALVAPVEEAIAAGVPVVMVDSGVNSDAPYAYIATDNLGAAAEGARILAELIGETGKVGNLGILAGSQTGSERDQGFLDEIANYPGITVLPTQFTGCDPAKALNAATDMLTANPDIVGFYSACGPNGLGIAQAVKAVGLEGKVMIVTFDPNPEVIPLFEDGTITAMIAQNPFAMGVQGVDAIHTIVTGGEIAEKNVQVAVTIITAENYNTPEVQALVTPPE